MEDDRAQTTVMSSTLDDEVLGEGASTSVTSSVYAKLVIPTFPSLAEWVAADNHDHERNRRVPNS